MNQHRVAEYAHGDQEDLVRFFRDVFAELGYRFDLSVEQRDLTRIPAEYQSRGGAFLIARDVPAGAVVGTVALRDLGGGVGEIKRFYIRADHRGRGLGAALLGRAIDHARSAGAWERLRLDTTTGSRAALALFRRSGFVEIPRYNDNPVAEIFMELPLGPAR